jgi:glycosyltransferase involved in cell wall biosynthesis
MNNPLKRKILFISHESSLTGGTILLVNLLSLLKETGVADFSIIVKRGGKLDDQFRQIANTIVLKPEGYQAGKGFFGKLGDFLSYRRRLRKMIREAGDCDLIFSNTVANGRLLKLLSQSGRAIVVYVHELESALKFCNIHRDTDLSLELADSIFSPSNAVTRNLIQHDKVGAGKIFPLNYYFSVPGDNFSGNKEDIKRKFFGQYRIPPDRFHVAGMGAAVERKGMDIFVETCRILKEMNAGIHFTWIGGFLDKGFESRIINFIKQSELEGHLTITGYIPHSFLNLIPFDLLALTSREDPYPLVVLEAAFARIPTVAFRGTGGMEDFIGDDAGFLVSEVSAEAMAQKIIEIRNSATEAVKRAEHASQKARALHTDADLILEQLEKGVAFALEKK